MLSQILHWSKQPGAFLLLKKPGKAAISVIEGSKALGIFMSRVGFKGFADVYEEISELVGVNAVITENAVSDSVNSLAEIFFFCH